MDGSEVELTGEIAAADFESFRREAMEEFRNDLELPGFRKGKVPDNLLIEKVGNEKILYEMAEHALAHYYPEILKEHQIDAIGRPEIAITKIAAGNPLGFKIKTAVMPEIKLPDYRKIAKTENNKPAENLDVTDKEVDEVIDEIRKNRAGAAKNSSEPEEKSEGGPEASADKDAELPELTDEFAKSLGQFESVADLRQKINENISLDKARRATEKKRLAIMESVIKEAKLDLPRALIESELHKMEHEMRDRLESMGLKFEDYLSHIKKTEADLHQDWEPEAIKRAKFALLLTAIAKEEKINADPAELDQEVKHLLEHYENAEPERVRAYAESVLQNEGVFKFLENQK